MLHNKIYLLYQDKTEPRNILNTLTKGLVTKESIGRKQLARLQNKRYLFIFLLKISFSKVRDRYVTFPRRTQASLGEKIFSVSPQSNTPFHPHPKINFRLTACAVLAYAKVQTVLQSSKEEIPRLHHDLISQSFLRPLQDIIYFFLCNFST